MGNNIFFLYLILVPKFKSFSKLIDENDSNDALDVKDAKILSVTSQVETEQMALNSLDGFLLVLSGEGEITYISENISDSLGLAQVN